MNSTIIEIYVALLMVGIAFGLVFWFRMKTAAASDRRRAKMMERVGLGPDFDPSDDTQLEAIIRETRQRCLKCQSEDVCERWLAGDISGDNDFCPNAHIFRELRADDKQINKQAA